MAWPLLFRNRWIFLTFAVLIANVRLSTGAITVRAENEAGTNTSSSSPAVENFILGTPIDLTTENISGVLTTTVSPADYLHLQQDPNKNLDLRINLSNKTVNASDGRPIFATPANHSSLLSFLENAQSYADEQARNKAVGNESNTYFRYTSEDYTFACIIRNQTDNGSSISEWVYFYLVIEAMRNLTRADPSQNTTWVARMWDPQSTKTVDILLVPSLRDIYLPSSYFSNASATSEDSTTVAAPASAPTDISLIGSGLVRETSPTTGPDRRDLITPRTNYAVGRWSDLGDTGFRFSLRRSESTILESYLLRDLLQSAYDTIVADSGSGGGYFGFCQLLPLAAMRSFRPNVQFNFEISGIGSVPKQVLLELAATLLKLAVYNNWDLRGRTVPALFGEIVTSHGNLVGRWTLGFVLKQLQPVLDNYGCLPGPSSGDRGSATCLFQEL